jgi:hypothetical protein
LIKSQVLYRLSYGLLGIGGTIGAPLAGVNPAVAASGHSLRASLRGQDGTIKPILYIRDFVFGMKIPMKL